MISGCAVSIPVTVARIAEGLTFLASEATARNKVTGFICGTFIVTFTAYFNTGNKWVALQTRRTNTNGNVKVHLTLSPAATMSSQARVHTLL
jgi:hypothetical protein